MSEKDAAVVRPRIECLSENVRIYVSDILSQSHVSSSPTLADVLDKLIRMGLVRKEAPINDENNRRKAGYYIADRLSLFYYRYCFRYASQMFNDYEEFKLFLKECYSHRRNMYWR